jgi:ribonuclease E
MSKIMLINVTHAEENRVGIVEDGQLESFEIESFSREHLKGNIYKGVIRRIHPAIEAAFVDIGAERDAFLPLDEICFRNLPSGRNGAGADKGKRRIKDVLNSGDEILVQIIKEQFTNKPPTLSTFYSLPGRYLVLLPGSEDAGISRKIEGEDRVRLREMIERLHPPPGCGIIVRTAAGFDEDQGELERDLNYLQRLWESIKKNGESRRGPAVIYREHDLVLRNIRDYFTPDINEMFIDNEEVYERAKDFLHNMMPGKEHLLHLYQGEQPIFSRFGLEAQIESIYKRRVQLKSGGSIVIDGTEALTAIDVNSGGSMRGASQEETASKTNLEAATEIARQLRLRDLGGIIVIDFIDMRVQSHINDVERTLRDAMRADKARHDIGRISRLGLLEVSRQRLRPAAAASSYTACPMCEGHGAVRTTESAALVALRKIHHRIAEGDVAQMKVSLPRDVAMYLLNQKRDDLAVLEARYAARIQVVISDKLMPHESEIETRTRKVGERAVPIVRPGEVAAAEVARPSSGTRERALASSAAVAVAPAAAAAGASARRSAASSLRERAAEAGAEGAEGHARRRRRRGGRGRREGAAETRAERAPAGGPASAPDAGVPSGPEAGAPSGSDAGAPSGSDAGAALEAVPVESTTTAGVAEGASEQSFEEVGEPVVTHAAKGTTGAGAFAGTTEAAPDPAVGEVAIAAPSAGSDLAAREPDSPDASAPAVASLPGAGGLAHHRAPWFASETPHAADPPQGDLPATSYVASGTPFATPSEPAEIPEDAAVEESSGRLAEFAPGLTAESEPPVAQVPARRRRRRGGKRGGRGRKTVAAAAEAGSSEGAPEQIGFVTERPESTAGSAMAENASGATDEAVGAPAGIAGSPGPEGQSGRRRGGGSRRRRTRLRHASATAGPAEPPAES